MVDLISSTEKKISDIQRVETEFQTKFFTRHLSSYESHFLCLGYLFTKEGVKRL